MGIIIIIIILIIAVAYIVIYNNIVATQKNVEEAWSDIDVQLKRRHDLIPNLIEIVKGYSKHEQELFEKIAEERSQAMNLSRKDLGKLSEIEDSLGTHIQSLFAVAEAYPTLLANTEYLKLQDELVETEDEVASSRRIYNSNTADYNTLIAVFPNNIVASVAHFTLLPFFQNNTEKEKV